MNRSRASLVVRSPSFTRPSYLNAEERTDASRTYRYVRMQRNVRGGTKTHQIIPTRAWTCRDVLESMYYPASSENRFRKRHDTDTTKSVKSDKTRQSPAYYDKAYAHVMFECMLSRILYDFSRARPSRWRSDTGSRHHPRMAMPEHKKPD